MKAKVYYFRYSHFIDKLVSGFFSLCGNFVMPIIALFIILTGMGITGINKYINDEILVALMSVSVLAGLFFAFKYCFCFKGVVLYDTYLEITTQNLGFGKDKPKFTINYSDIVSAYNSNFNLRYDRRKAKRSLIAGDYSDYIEITLKGGKQFCFSVDRQTEFLDELLYRMELLNDK